jgi:hypothetical protein
MTPSGMEAATFRLVVQCLNQLRHYVPLLRGVNIKIQKAKDSVLLECYNVLSGKDLQIFLRPA